MTFLALLELMKMGALRAVQEDRYGRIVIELAVADVDAVSFGGLDEYDGAPRGVRAEGGEDGRSQ